MDRTSFLAALDGERVEWDSALAQINETQMLQPGVVGDWAVKDLVAHVIWFEREMVRLIQRRSLQGESPLWTYSAIQRTGLIYEENRGRPLAQVLTEARAVFAQLSCGVLL